MFSAADFGLRDNPNRISSDPKSNVGIASYEASPANFGIARCDTSQGNSQIAKLRAITRHQSLDTEGQSQTDAQGPRLLATKCKLSLPLWRIVEERWRRRIVAIQPAGETASCIALWRASLQNYISIQEDVAVDDVGNLYLNLKVVIC